MSAIQPSPEHAEAHDALNRAIVNAAKNGRTIPCLGSERYVSDDREEMEHLSVACILCPARRECSAAGEFESCGVWGGHVITKYRPTPPTPGGPAIAEVLRLLEAGESPYLICQRVGRHPGSIAASLRKINRHDLAPKFTAVESTWKAA